MKVRSKIAAIVLWLIPLTAFTAEISSPDMLSIGKRIYHSKGANSCVMCHGANGQGGTVTQEAAHLNQPTKWKIYQATQGDPVKMEKAAVDLIRLGAVQFNQQVSTLHPDLKLPAKLNPLMFGIQQAPTLSEIESIRNELEKLGNAKLSKDEMRALAAKAVYAYIQTFKKP